MSLFKEVGFEIIFLRSKRPDNYKEELNKIKLHKQFKDYELEDIEITNFIIYAGRGKYLKNNEPKYELIEFPADKEDRFL